MKNMTLENIAKACKGQYVGSVSDSKKVITGAQVNSRLIKDGNLFFAAKGEKTDGHKYIDSAYDNGAICVVCEVAPTSNGIEDEADIAYKRSVRKPYILVENSLQALKDIARFYRSQLTIPIVGITGSVGKTSTKEAIAGVLSIKYDVLKTAGNFNNEVGLPLTILSIQDHHQVAVCEMGISDFGEMDRLSEIAVPDICVITNIGHCHLENLGTQQGILKAKTEMFHHRNPKGAVILNGDDPLLNTIIDVDGTRPIRFGYSEDCDLKIEDVKLQGLYGSDFNFKVKNGTLPCHSSLPGGHVVMNSACAACVGHELGLTDGEIKQGVTRQESVAGRSNIIEACGYTILDDCYNANPASMREAVDLLNLAQGRKVAVLGDMFELGAEEKKYHYEVGRYAAQNGIDILLLAGKLSENTYNGALDYVKESQGNGDRKDILIKYYPGRDELMDDIYNNIKDGDSILVKASHGMKFEEIVKQLQVVREND